MTRNEIKLLAIIAAFVALTAARIVSAQESADASPSAGGAGLGGPVPAKGSPAAPPQSAAGELVANDEATVLVLAIAMVAEAGWDAAEDHAAIAHVLRKRAERRGVTLQQQAVEYVSAFKVATPRSRWLLALNLDATKPDGWPEQLSWSSHIPLWLAVVERSRAFLAGTVADPCSAGVVHWGMRGGVDQERARRAGMVLARCSSRTRNAFYRVASR